MNGLTKLKQLLSNLPEAPGIYKMLGEDGRVLYVGKAKNIKKRVGNYCALDRLTNRICRMVMLIENVETVVTPSEAEAFLLEATLIKKFNPHYNILLKDDKSFPYIYIGAENDFPMIGKHRGEKNRRGDYFGPFAAASDVYKTITAIQKTFLIRNCSDAIFNTRKRPCLEYQIKRCSAPCVGKINKEDYSKSVKQAKNFLLGKTQDIREELAEQMEKASAAFQYEKAAEIRDRIKAISNTQSSKFNISFIEDADIIIVVSQAGKFCIHITFCRGGKSYGSKVYFPDNTENATEEELLEFFIEDFYQQNPPPKELIVSAELKNTEELENTLKEISGEKVSILAPSRGSKYSVLQSYTQLAREHLEKKIAEKETQKNILKRLKEVFDLEVIPKRIEVFDNSHTMGENKLGAMIVGSPDGFIKNSYRKYNIKTVEQGDDYGMLREVLTRRYGKADQDAVWPDLILIDGGAGHFSTADMVFTDLNLKIPFVCIAKGPNRNAGEETFFMKGRTPFKFAKNDPVLYYLQRLRDEAHRFAITGHRAKMLKKVSKSGLDTIEGIGPRRKKALLTHFGSFDAVKEATLEDLMKVEGIEKSIAKKIYNHIHR